MEYQAALPTDLVFYWARSIIFVGFNNPDSGPEEEICEKYTFAVVF